MGVLSWLYISLSLEFKFKLFLVAGYVLLTEEVLIKFVDTTTVWVKFIVGSFFLLVKIWIWYLSLLTLPFFFSCVFTWISTYLTSELYFDWILNPLFYFPRCSLFSSFFSYVNLPWFHWTRSCICHGPFEVQFLSQVRLSSG